MYTKKHVRYLELLVTCLFECRLFSFLGQVGINPTGNWMKLPEIHFYHHVEEGCNLNKNSLSNCFYQLLVSTYVGQREVNLLVS